MDEQEDEIGSYISWNQQIKICEKIGNGCQGNVYRAINKVRKEEYAIKVISRNCVEKKQEERLKREIGTNFILSTKNYHYFPHFYGFWQSTEKIYMVFQFCQGNALQILTTHSNIYSKYSFIYVLFFDILKAIETLHSHSIIHRDIKLQNILFQKGKFKICDLGLSANILQKRRSIEVGNLIAKAPEVYSGEYDQKVDIWSLGVTIYMMVYGTFPFDQQTNNLIRQKHIDKFVNKFSKGGYQIMLKDENRLLIDILEQMLKKERKERLSASQLLKRYFSQQKFPHQRRFIKIKNIFHQYLMSRFSDNCNQYYFLMLLLLFNDFTKMDEKLTDEKNQHKKQICLIVKLQIFYFLKFIYGVINSSKVDKNHSLCCYLLHYVEEWENQLRKDKPSLVKRNISSEDEALEFHQNQKIRNKFPLLPIAVQIFKTKIKEDKKEQIFLWNIPIDLRKLHL